MRTLLLVATVLVLFALAVGAVSAHDGNPDDDQMNDDRMNEMMDRCLAMMDHAGEMMGSGPMAANGHSESMNTEMEHQNDATQNGESSHTGMGCC